MYSQIHFQQDQMMVCQPMQYQQADYLHNVSMQASQENDSSSHSTKRNGKRGYVQWELWKRQSLIQKVENEGMTIKDAAKAFDINYSTAKHIMKVFRQTGEVETKIMMKRNKKDSSDSLKTEATLEASKHFTMMYQPISQQQYSNYSKFQGPLPVDEKMEDVNFHAESFDLEDKINIHNFLFADTRMFQ